MIKLPDLKLKFGAKADKPSSAPKANAPKAPKAPPFDFKKMAEEFRNLDPKEPGTWPLLPQLLACLAVVAVVLLVTWWFVWQGQIDEFNGKVAEEKQLREQWLEKKRKTINIEAYRQQLADIDRSFGQLLKQLPNKSEMESLLVDINQAGVGRGLKFELFKPNPEVIKDFYAELPITIKLTGGYHEFGAFAGDLAKMPRIVTINDLDLSQAKAVDSKQGVAAGALSFSATAKTFRYLDEEEVAKQRKAAAAAKAK